jgi:hypothetical protein
MPNEFIPRKIGQKDCGDGSTFGRLSTRYDYVMKGLTNDLDYPLDACRPWLHYNMKVGNLQALQAITAPQFRGGRFTGTFQGTINVQSWKGFDIKHPTKENYRLRHICLEGPEGGVYFRGRLTNSNVIKIPDYWKNLVDPQSITVSLTQIGSSQDLIIDKIELENGIFIRSGTASNIDCYYVVNGSRIDGDPLIVEYEGETPAEYPGDDTQYSISGYDYDARGLNSTKDFIESVDNFVEDVDL